MFYNDSKTYQSMDYDLERYPKIAEIKNFIEQYEIRIFHTEDNDIAQHCHLTAMTLVIKNKTYTVLVDDEYEDLKKNNELLDFILVFRELAIIEESSDFLEWCSELNLQADNYKILDYYKQLSSEVESIKLLFKDNTIDYFISDLEFQLNSGAIQLLRK